MRAEDVETLQIQREGLEILETSFGCNADLKCIWKHLSLGEKRYFMKPSDIYEKLMK